MTIRPYKVFTPFWKTAEIFYLDKGFRKEQKIQIKKKKINFLGKSKEFKIYIGLKKNGIRVLKNFGNPLKKQL